MVCLPKAEGGLGVLNLKTQNEALLLKNLHKFYKKMDTHPGYTLSGINTIRMANSLVTLKKDLSGGEIILNFWINSKVWLCVIFRMGPLASSGQTSGEVKCKVKLTQSFSPLLRTDY
jgi:hypothetical protein